jgi:crotonobetainyl-CoA:carnitine CoA-transferase CaiB-like acyl-CoA transferase
MARALEGIRVVDLTAWFQGPVSTQHLADFGAEVIKVERPKGGDPARGVRSMKALEIGDWNQYFLVINRNKQSMALDLKQPEGLEILYRLVEKSDVMLSNLTPTQAQAMGLSYEKISSINPKLIYATNTGYGRFGEKNKPSFDMTVQALTGIMARLGEPGEPPIYLGMGSGDAYGGMMSALGIALALFLRKRTGKGQYLDASLYGAQLFLAAPYLQGYLATGSERFSKQQSRRQVDNPLWNLYPTADKWMVVCELNLDERFERLCEALGASALAVDERFSSSRLRGENNQALVTAIEECTRARGSAEWAAIFAEKGIAASPINTLADVVKDEQAWANDYLMKAYCEEVKREVEIRGMPVRLSKTPGRVDCLGPELGQNTELLMMDLLEYSWEEIEAFKAKGAIP